MPPLVPHAKLKCAGPLNRACLCRIGARLVAYTTTA